MWNLHSTSQEHSSLRTQEAPRVTHQTFSDVLYHAALKCDWMQKFRNTSRSSLFIFIECSTTYLIFNCVKLLCKWCIVFNKELKWQTILEVIFSINYFTIYYEMFKNGKFRKSYAMFSKETNIRVKYFNHMTKCYP